MCFVILNVLVHFEWDDFGFVFFPYVQLHLPRVVPPGLLNLLLGKSLYAVGWWLVIGDNVSLGFPFLYFSCHCNVFGAAGVQQNQTHCAILT